MKNLAAVTFCNGLKRSLICSNHWEILYKIVVQTLKKQIPTSYPAFVTLLSERPSYEYETWLRQAQRKKRVDRRFLKTNCGGKSIDNGTRRRHKKLSKKTRKRTAGIYESVTDFIRSQRPRCSEIYVGKINHPL